MVKADRRGRIVLVHGAAHGAWCWEALTPLLEQQGFEVDTLDLPGLGDDPTPPKNVTLQSYIDRVVDVVRAKPGKVTLVGHSMGGAPISGAGEAVPEQIGKLIYLAAFLPKDGESMMSLMQQVGQTSAPSATDALVPCDVEGAHGFNTALASQAFYNTCPPDVAVRATARLRPQADAPLGEPIHISAARWGAIPKTYIVCKRDQALPPDVQRIMAAQAPEAKIIEIDTDHSPFYSAAGLLADIVVAEAASW